MKTLLRVTGVGALISFYRYIYFNGPGLVKFSGIGLILLVGGIHTYELPKHYETVRYIGVAFGVLLAGSLVSALGILRGGRWGWTLGSGISAVALVAYAISRTLGLPGFGAAVGEWAEPLGTIAVIVEVLYLGLHFSIITGLNVASPEKRDWHD